MSPNDSYGLDGLGIESWRRRNFSHLSRLAPGLTQPPTHWVPGLFHGDKAVGRGVVHPPPLTPRIKKE